MRLCIVAERITRSHEIASPPHARAGLALGSFSVLPVAAYRREGAHCRLHPGQGEILAAFRAPGCFESSGAPAKDTPHIYRESSALSTPNELARRQPGIVSADPSLVPRFLTEHVPTYPILPSNLGDLEVSRTRRRRIIISARKECGVALTPAWGSLRVG